MLRYIPIQAYIAVFTSGLIFLLIFLGAWVVSADRDGTAWEMAFAGYSNPSQWEDRPNSGDLPATHRDNFQNPENSEDLADTWWGESLLVACPFH